MGGASQLEYLLSLGPQRGDDIKMLIYLRTSQCPVTDRTPAPDEAEMPKVKHS